MASSVYPEVRGVTRLELLFLLQQSFFLYYLVLSYGLVCCIVIATMELFRQK